MPDDPKFILSNTLEALKTKLDTTTQDAYKVMYEIGEYYHDGVDAAPNLSMAAYWYIKSLRNLSLNTTEGTKVADQIIARVQQACEQAEPNADMQALLALCYACGCHTISKKTDTAIELATASAHRNSALAWWALAIVAGTTKDGLANTEKRINYHFQWMKASINNSTWLTVAGPEILPMMFPLTQKLFNCIPLQHVSDIDAQTTFLFQALLAIDTFTAEELAIWEHAQYIFPLASNANDTAELELEHYKTMLARLLTRVVIDQNSENKKTFGCLLHLLIIARKFDMALMLMQEGISPIEQHAGKNILHALAVTDNLDFSTLISLFNYCKVWCRSKDNEKALTEFLGEIPPIDKLMREQKFFEKLIFSAQDIADAVEQRQLNPFELAIQSNNVAVILLFLESLGFISNLSTLSQIDRKQIGQKIVEYLKNLASEGSEIDYTNSNTAFYDLALAVGSSTAILKLIQLEQANAEPDVEKIAYLHFYLAKEETTELQVRKSCYQALKELAASNPTSMKILYYTAQCLELGYGTKAEPEAANALYLNVKQQNVELFNAEKELRINNIVRPLYQAAKNHDKTAFKQLLTLADHGGPDDGFTANIVGRCYAEGWGTKASNTKACHYFSIASKAGNSGAFYNLGVRWFKQGDHEKSAFYFLHALLNGQDHLASYINKIKTGTMAPAKQALAEYYFEKDAIDENAETAIELLNEIMANKASGSYSHSKARLHLAQAYESGRGVAQNADKAVKYYIKAATSDLNIPLPARDTALTKLIQYTQDEKVSLYALNKLGRYYYKLKDYEQSFPLFLRAAQQGHISAIYNVAKAYLKGQGIKSDITKASEWIMKGITSDIASDNNKKWLFELIQPLEAQLSPAKEILAVLGVCYLYGYGVDKDENKAHKLLLKAAKKGVSLAHYYLGIASEQGQGTKRDVSMACDWYLSAAHNKSKDTDDSGKLALNALQRLAEQSPISLHAINNLGYCYQHGYSIASDADKAASLYTQAAQAGYAEGMYNLAYCYIYSIGLPQNIALALYWYFKAIEINNREDYRKKYSERLQNCMQSNSFLTDINQLDDPQRSYLDATLTQHVKNITPLTFPLIGLLVKCGAQLKLQAKESKGMLLEQALSYINNLNIDALRSWKTVLTQSSDNSSSSSTIAEVSAEDKLTQLKDYLKSTLITQLQPLFTKDELTSLLGYFITNEEDAFGLALAQAGINPEYSSSMENNFLHLIARRNNLTNVKINNYVSSLIKTAVDHGISAQQFIITQLFANNASDRSPIEWAIDNENTAAIAVFLLQLDLIDTFALSNEEIFTKLGDLYNSNTLTDLAKQYPCESQSLLSIDRYTNLARAREFYQRSVQLGSEEAKVKLAESYMQEEPADKTNAVDWYIKAANGPAHTYAQTTALAALTQLAQGADAVPAAEAYLAALIPPEKDRDNKLAYEALAAGDFAKAQQLVTAGANLRYIDQHSNNIFHIFAKNCVDKKFDNEPYVIDKFFSVIETWLQHNKAQNETHFYADLLLASDSTAAEKTPLRLAAESENPALINAFMQRLNWTELHWAVYIKEPVLAKDIAAKSEQYWQIDILGRTPIRLALQLSCWDMLVAALPQTPLSVTNPKCKGLGEYLYLAVDIGHCAAVEQLLYLNADVNWHIPEKDNNKVKEFSPKKVVNTPEPLLHVAAAMYNVEMFTLLLKYTISGKIDLNTKNKQGLTITAFIADKISQIELTVKEAGQNLATYDSVRQTCDSQLKLLTEMQQHLAQTIEAKSKAKASESWLSRWFSPKSKEDKPPAQPALGSSRQTLERYMVNCDL